MRCPECKKDLENFKQYILHLDFIHNITNYFICPIENCNRTYDTKYSLKAHLTASHLLYTQHTLHSDETDLPMTPPSDLDNAELESLPTDPNIENISTEIDPETSRSRYNIDDTLLQLQTELNSNVLSLITSLYDTLNIPRSTVQNLIEVFKLFLKTSMSPIKSLLLVLIGNDELNENSFNTLRDVINMFENCFNPLDTEYKLVNVFSKSGNLVQPVGHKVGVSKVSQRNNSAVVMHLKEDNVYLIPLRKTLKLFLELPGVLDIILDYQKDIMDVSNLLLRNVVNGTLWQILSDNNTDTIIPLFVYYDDFESGNPLGSHAGKHKIGAVYSTLATIPPQYASRLDNVFLTFLFYSRQRTTFGNKATFEPLLTELKYLESTGIDVCIDNKKQNIKFPLMVLCGDNLGLNSVLGCVESFSSNSYCRICTMNKNECQRETVENTVKIRRKEDYDFFLENNVGLKESCVWHSLERFHIFENNSLDVMHDLCEGVHRYGMAAVVKSFVDRKCFTLQQLNSRIKYFTYSKCEHNHPPEVTKQHLSNGSIIFSASEMLCFVRNFRFMIGDMVDENDEVFDYYLTLLELTDNLMSQVFSSEQLEYLKGVISEHHEKYMNLFQTHLKPKHHFMLHYPGIIKKVGPPIFFSAFKFEAKHKDLKRVAHSTTCRRNLSYSIGLRCELKNSCRYICREGIQENVKVSKMRFQKVPHYMQVDFSCVSTYEINGVIYDTTSSVLLYFVSRKDEPSFLKINNIFVKTKDLDSVLLSCQKLRICGYNDHFKAYHVELCNNDEEKLVTLSDCCDKLPMSLRSVDGIMYVSWPLLLS